MLSRRCLAAFALMMVAALAFAAAPTTMSVQVKNGQLRATPSFLGKIVAPVVYGAQVQVLETQGEWNKVSGAGATGWIHNSALSRKKIVMNAGQQTAQTGASSDELALAGKGFNSDIESQFKNGNKSVDYTWVDKMEKIKVSPEEVVAFLKEGGVKPVEGGAP